MKRLLIGSLAAMLVAFPLYANTVTSDESQTTTPVEATETGTDTTEQRMEETPAQGSTPGSSPVSDPQMEQEPFIESGDTQEGAELQEDDTESEL